MTSRLTRLERIPWWPIAMPSVTVMVLKRRGVPPASITPSRQMSAWKSSVVLHGALSLPAEATATNGRAISSSVMPIA